MRPREFKRLECVEPEIMDVPHITVNNSATMVVFSHYPSDPRVRREAEALRDDGFRVTVICLSEPGHPSQDVFDGVMIQRLNVHRRRAGRVRYIWEYVAFTVLAFFRISRQELRRRSDLIQVHNMPDFLVFSALTPRLLGTKLILDLHDPSPEVFMAKYRLPKSHPIIWLLRVVEKASIRFAHLVVTPNKSFCHLFASRSCSQEKIETVMNSPQEHIFSVPANSGARSDDAKEFTIMYHGTIAERNGLDLALDAVQFLRTAIPKIRFLVFGTGDFVDVFKKRTELLGLGRIVDYKGHVSLEEIARSILEIDLGLIPNRSDPFTRINLPTRIFEYLSLGKAVVSPRTPGILDYFSDDSMFLFEPGSSASLAQVILEIYRNPEKKACIVDRGMEVLFKHRWELQKKHYVSVVHQLLAS